MTTGPVPADPLALSLPAGSVVLTARAVALCRAGLAEAIAEQRRRGLPLPGDAVVLLAQLDAAATASPMPVGGTASGPADRVSRLPMSASGPLLASALLPDGPSAPEMTAQEAADVLAVQPRQIRRLVGTGVLSGRRVGPLWMVSAESVAAYRERCRARA